MPDVELEAMTKIADALNDLESEVAERVLSWATQRYGRRPKGPTGGEEAPVRDKPSDTIGFMSFGELFHAADPKSDKEKALLAAFWVQTAKGLESFASQALNSELKDLGYGVGNITDALSALMKERPAMVIQLRKSGTSKQARKTYKVTEAGRRRVEEMVRAGNA